MQSDYPIHNLSFFSFILGSVVPAFWLDLKTGETGANQAFFAAIDCTPDRLKSFLSFSVDYRRDLLRSKGFTRFETLIKLKNGKEISAEIINSYHCIKDAEFIVSFVYDISDKKQCEHQSVLINSLIELSKDNIFIIDTENMCIAYANDMACRSTGYTKDEITGLHVSKIRKPATDGITFPQYVAMLKNSSQTTSLGVVVRRDGSVLDVETSLSLLNFQEKSYVVAIARDITERLAKEKELKDLNRLLEQKVSERTKELEEHRARLEERVQEEIALRRKQETVLFAQQKFVDMSRMLNAIAHHWRQPLNSIGLIVQDINDNRLESSRENYDVEQSCSTAMNLINEMSETINQFSYFFRKEEESSSQFSPAETLASLINLIKIQMTKQGTNLSVSLPEDTCARVQGSETRLKDVLMSIMDNASEAVSENMTKPGTPPACISVSLFSDADYVFIAIEDNGGGISDDILPKIFEPYYTTKKDPKSTGLGLFMCKTIIEEHFGGKLTPRNTGNGLSMEIQLPAAK